METIRLNTTKRSEMVEITSQVMEVVRQWVHVSGGGPGKPGGSFVGSSEGWSGYVLVYVPHTTAGITINENADADVVDDMLGQLDKMVPWSQPFYRHGEGNSASHVKASMMGSSVCVLIEQGQLVLGTWQGIWFCEFDGPRTRKVHVKVIAD